MMYKIWLNNFFKYVLYLQYVNQPAEMKQNLIIKHSKTCIATTMLITEYSLKQACNIYNTKVV